ncbi:hypothetical protein JCM3770_002625 [Rhodotorula araucariae]
MPPPPHKPTVVLPSTTPAANRRSRLSPAAGSPGYRFPEHPYAATATSTPPVSPLDAAEPQLPRTASLKDDRRVQDKEFKNVEHALARLSLKRPKRSQSPPRSDPRPPLPSAKSLPSAAATPPSRPRERPSTLTTLSSAPTELASPATNPDAYPSYTVSGIAAASNPPERKASDISSRAHDSALPFRSLGGAAVPGQEHSPASARTVHPPSPVHLTVLGSPTSRWSLSVKGEKVGFSEKCRKAALGSGIVRSASQASSTQRRKAVKKWIALVAIGLIVMTAIAVGVGASAKVSSAAEGTTPSAASSTGATWAEPTTEVVVTQTFSSSLPTALATLPDDVPVSSSAISRPADVEATQAASLATRDRSSSSSSAAETTVKATTARSTRIAASPSSTSSTARSRAALTDEPATVRRRTVRRTLLAG